MRPFHMLPPLAVALLLPLLPNGATAPGAWQLRYIDLRISIEPERQAVRGVSRLTFTTGASEVADLLVDAADSLTIDSAFVAHPDGGRTMGVREPGLVRFALRDRARTGAPYVATLWYQGRPVRRAVGFVSRGGQSRAASFGIPRSAREWWPSADSPDQKADSADIRITAAASLIAASNGRLVGRVVAADGTMATAHWAVRYPIYSDVVSFSLADFAVTRSTVTLASGAQMPLEYYLFPEDSAKGAATLVNVPRIIAFLEQRLGGYPFAREKYAFAEFTRPSFREGHTITNLGATHVSGQADMDQLLAHEIAHQWFGNALTVVNWSHIWLNESLSEYMAWQWIRASQGDAAYRALLRQAATATSPAPMMPASPTDFTSMFGNATFQRGPAVLELLEREIGAEAFGAAVHQYVAQYAYRLVETADFQRACERAAGRSLDPFFAKWVRGNETFDAPK